MGIRLQAGKAALAERTAASRSFAADKGTVDSKAPSKGEMTGRVAEVDAFTNCPRIKFCTGAYFIIISFDVNCFVIVAVIVI
jgi:hypothetical protein